MAYLGLLDDAAPLFGSRTSVPGAGVLLALPPLVHSGVFECAENIYGSLGPAFYGLRTSLLTLLLMALWRIKLVNDNYSSPSVTIKTHHGTGLSFCSVSLFTSLSVTLWASPFGGAESLGPSGPKDVAEPKGLAGAPG